MLSRVPPAIVSQALTDPRSFRKDPLDPSHFFRCKLVELLTLSFRVATCRFLLEHDEETVQHIDYLIDALAESLIAPDSRSLLRDQALDRRHHRVIKIFRMGRRIEEAVQVGGIAVDPETGLVDRFPAHVGQSARGRCDHLVMRHSSSAITWETGSMKRGGVKPLAARM